MFEDSLNLEKPYGYGRYDVSLSLPQDCTFSMNHIESSGQNAVVVSYQQSKHIWFGQISALFLDYHLACSSNSDKFRSLAETRRVFIAPSTAKLLEKGFPAACAPETWEFSETIRDTIVDLINKELEIPPDLSQYV